MFKFAFDIEEEFENPFQNEFLNTSKTSARSEISEWYNSEEIIPNSDIIEHFDICRLNASIMSFGEMELSYMVSGILLKNLGNDCESSKDIQIAEQNHSDLIPGIYEGGAKLWECTTDLLNYLYSNFDVMLWKDKLVLDLGCGSGILGIYALKNGSTVHFQDYNKDVLENFTIPNVLLNLPLFNERDKLEELKKSVKFFSGDWNNYMNLPNNDLLFDIILTSETIYNPENQQKLLNVFDKKLKPNGTVLVAAKTHYFGVGGNLRQFEDLISKNHLFKSSVLWRSTDNIGREIIQLKKIKDIIK